MKNFKLTTKVLALGFMAFFIANCSHSSYKDKKTTATTTTEVEWAKTKWPGITQSDLNRGKVYYEANCGKCHRLHNPSEYEEEGWAKIMVPMNRKAKIADSTADVISHYLVTAGHSEKMTK